MAGFGARIDSLEALSASSPALHGQSPPYAQQTVKVAQTAALLRMLSDFTASTADIFTGLSSSTREAQGRIDSLSNR